MCSTGPIRTVGPEPLHPHICGPHSTIKYLRRSANERRHGQRLCTTIKYLRGAAGIGLSTTIKYLRRTTSAAAGSGLGTTIMYFVANWTKAHYTELGTNIVISRQFGRPVHTKLKFAVCGCLELSASGAALKEFHSRGRCELRGQHVGQHAGRASLRQRAITRGRVV
jgi:hypothetical protein